MTNLSYRCTSCDYLYNPQEHNGLGLDSQNDDWECPDCQAPSDQFARVLPDDIEPADDEGAIETGTTNSRSTVLVSKSDLSVFELNRRYTKGNLQLQPDFQRYSVWSNKQASQLIESVFLNVPIPMIFLSEEDDGKLHVIDGQQRLNSFFRFLNNDLKLTGLETIVSYNGKTYNKLTAELQSTLEDHTLRVITILRNSDPDVKFEVFKRLNTGGTQLNDQELRNCIYRGDFNAFLKKVSAYNPFLSILGIDKPHPRMADVELALRFIAFYDQTYLNYPGSMKKFLNEQMWRQLNVDDVTLKNFEEKFKQSVNLSLSVFGEYAFRRFVPGNEDDPNGYWEAGRGQRKFNRALFDIVMYGFTRYPKSSYQNTADAIREELIYLMTNDLGFIDAITRGTSGTKQVTYRFKKWLDAIDNIAGQVNQGPRNYASSFKKQLYDQNSTCELCGQDIMLVEDAEVHHHLHYWRGGQTIPSNAKLVHRYCNRHEGGGH